MKKTGLFLLVLFLLACRKDPPILPDPPAEIKEPEQWEQFIGDYKVYDTTGIYLYCMNISHFSGLNQANVEVDSIRIENFANKFDLKFQYSISNYHNSYLDIGFHYGILDYNNKKWMITGQSDDKTTNHVENALVNDTMVMYFLQSNLRYYIEDQVFYYECMCKHVAVKQHK